MEMYLNMSVLFQDAYSRYWMCGGTLPNKWNVPLCVLFLQSQQEKDAERLQPVHPDHAHHVHAVGAVRLPHLLW